LLYFIRALQRATADGPRKNLLELATVH